MKRKMHGIEGMGLFVTEYFLPDIMVKIDGALNMMNLKEDKNLGKRDEDWPVDTHCLVAFLSQTDAIL